MPAPLTALFPNVTRSELEPHLPSYVKPIWYEDHAEAAKSINDVEVCWIDMLRGRKMLEGISKLKWFFTIGAGVEQVPMDLLRDKGVRLSNGKGLSADNCADYIVLGILVGAKRFHEVMRAHDRKEWLPDAPGKIELQGTKALIIGYGHIGEAIGRRLVAFDVEVTGVRSKADPAKGILGPDDWRPKLGEYDWVVVAAPSTSGTKALIGREELAAMKSTAWLLNVARGNLVDTEAVCETLSARKIGGAFLDVTDPEPLPSDHKLWTMPETLITAHLSGRSQNAIFRRASRLFLRNLERYTRGEQLENEVDLQRGY